MKFSILIAIAFSVMSFSQQASAGTISDSYSTGDTLTATLLNNIKTAVNDNDTTKQDRITGACSSGSAISTVNSDGTVVCETDTDTTYSAGTGLELNGTTFSISDSPAGIAYVEESTCCTDVPTTEVEIESVTIDAPSTGFVIVSYSGTCGLWHVNEASNIVQSITIAISTSSANTATSSRKTFTLTGNAGSGSHTVPCTTQQVLPVTVGTQTFYLNAVSVLPRSGETASIGWGNMHALFVPTQY